MSGRQRLRKPSNSLPLSSPILQLVDNTASDAFIEYAQTDDHAMAIHRFLLVVAREAMIGKVDHQKSAAEVWRVMVDEAALMLIHDGKMVGTMGLIVPDWWYSNDRFMTDRWHFVLPAYKNTDHAKLLKQEALKLAAAAGLPFIDQGKVRVRNGEYLMMPRLHLPEQGD
jgi:hypothetical protein